jgi:hypothetical protein
VVAKRKIQTLAIHFIVYHLTDKVVCFRYEIVQKRKVIVVSGFGVDKIIVFCAYCVCRPMPDIDSLMQEWPADVEQQLRETGLPIVDLDCDLPQYVDIVCSKYIMSESDQKLLIKQLLKEYRLISLVPHITFFVLWNW